MSKRLQRILDNPTLHPDALTDEERLLGGIKWHRYADSPRSSQVFCISAFGTLRNTSTRDEVIDHFLSISSPVYQRNREVPEWEIRLEYENSKLLSEYKGQSTSIDVFLVSSNAVFSVEAKFISDAKSGFGGCSQFNQRHCAGFFGPGSDQKTLSQTWCRLETWEGNRSPRTYWTIGREYFRPEVFHMQRDEDQCPLGDFNYQLMRNFLFAAAYARTKNIRTHGTITIAPAATSALLEYQVERFRTKVLLPEHADKIEHTSYDEYVKVLHQIGDGKSAELGSFLTDAINSLVRA